MDGVKKETNVNPKEAEKVRGQVGLTPDEVRELNRPKRSKFPPAVRPVADSFGGRGGSKTLERAANVLATSLTAAGGVGLVWVADEALKNAPPAIAQEAPQGDPLNRKPPKGVEFGKVSQVPRVSRASGPIPDAPVGAPTYRVLLPRVLKDISGQKLEEAERPLWPAEFGAPERGVIMRNKVEQGGRNPAWVEMGDQELFNNLLYLRGTYGRPDLKLEITFYSSVDLLLRDPNAPRYIAENYRGVLIYDSWAGGNGTFQNGSILFKNTESDRTLHFYITLPEVYKSKVPTQRELELLHLFFVNDIGERIFSSNENGRSNLPYPISPGSPVAQDLDTHRPVAYENGVTRSAFRVKLETIPTTGGK